MKKTLLYLFAVLLAISFNGCATWEGMQDDTHDAIEVTKEVSEEAWEKTKEVSTDAWEGTKKAVGAD
jgi:hypothetical protein